MATNTKAIESDPRFRHVLSDPRFKRVPRKVRKVTIDPRFKSMFSDKRFKLKYSVDKRGRKVKETSSENLKKFYELEEEDQSKDEELSGNSCSLDEKEDKVLSQKMPTGDQASDNETESVDYARGEGSLESSSSSSDDDDESLSDEEETGQQLIHDWAELDSSVTHGDEVSKRLAVCNMNWDRITAHDLYVLFNSFKPSGGVVISVKIFPSDFGMERMAAEEVAGPVELLDGDSSKETTEGSGYSEERLRQYQLNRLKYYYAVVECDSTDTAIALYNQCDGSEYESSSSTIDLRFIPDHMIFDDRKPTSVCTDANITKNFQPSNFCTAALQQSSVQLTWDETDPKRVKTMMRKFNKDELLDMDLKAYVASSSDEEEPTDATTLTDQHIDDGATSRPVSEEERIAKYRALLSAAQEQGVADKSLGEEEMEITFEPGLQDTAKDLVKRKLGERDKGLSTWETYLRQKKQKKKVRQRMAKIEEDEDEVGIDDLSANEVPSAKKKRKKHETDERIDEQQKGELELLMMGSGEEDGKAHFSLKGILKKEKMTKKRQRKNKRIEDSGVQDTFEIDVGDPRFSALYGSHEYALDPSNPSYKPTRGMQALVNERLRLRKQQSADTNGAAKDAAVPHANSSVAELVKSIKSKAGQQFKSAHRRPSPVKPRKKIKN